MSDVECVNLLHVIMYVRRLCEKSALAKKIDFLRTSTNMAETVKRKSWKKVTVSNAKLVQIDEESILLTPVKLCYRKSSCPLGSGRFGVVSLAKIVSIYTKVGLFDHLSLLWTMLNQNQFKNRTLKCSIVHTIEYKCNY